MAIIYRVTIDTAEKETRNADRFHIKWLNLETDTEDSFEQTCGEINPVELKRRWQFSGSQKDIGKKLFKFLDGDARHFTRALAEAREQGESLQLHLHTCSQLMDWPFELLAQEGDFLLPNRIHLVHRVSDWGAAIDPQPKGQQLKLLFMTCSALDIEPELDFEKEEEAIFFITEKLAMEMEVEDSGSLEGLRSQLVQKQYDIVHLSGHANIDEKGCPYFIMENETGNHHKVFPDELWEEALIENPPRLLFLSGCRTGEAPDTTAAASFARVLVEKHNVPAVLGWGRSVADEQAIHAEKVLYHELSRGRSILKAVQRARYELVRKYQTSPEPAWPLLRLFSSGMSLNAIVKENQKRQTKSRRMKQIYLQNSQVQVLAEGFVGRRRQLQQCLRTLNDNPDKVGVLLLGAGGLGKSCLAGKICERFRDYTLIIVHGKLNSISLGAALKDAFIISQDGRGEQILAQKLEMTRKVANLCTTSFQEENYLLLLDNFEQNLEGADRGEPGSLLVEAADLLKALLHYLPFSGGMTQLIITCRYDFSLTEHNRELVGECLEKVWLTSFQESQMHKKARELENILKYEDQPVMEELLAAGLGNPRLMELIDILIGQLKTEEESQWEVAIKNKQDDFIRELFMGKLLEQGGRDLTRFLIWLSIYRRPVQLEGVRMVAEKAGIKNWEDLLKKGMGLSLVEHDQAHHAYMITPLLQEELISRLDDTQSCHHAAYEYYENMCKDRKPVDPILMEEWIYHALGCKEEITASDQGGRLVKHFQDRLAFRESRRVGEWILAEKKQELANEYDAFLLNETAFTLKCQGEYKTAIKYYEKALAIDRSVCGDSSDVVARDLNNLGSLYRAIAEPDKAVEYYESAWKIVKSKDFEGKKPDSVGILLDNLGTAWGGKGNYDKAIEYYEQSLTTWKKVLGERHPNVAITLNNLGSAWNRKGDIHRAVEYFKQALSIDLEVYGNVHRDVATDLNNLGAACYDLGDYQKAIEYYEEALTLWKKIYREKHQNIAVTMVNLGKVYLALEQKEKAKQCIGEAYPILKELLGPEHPSVKEAATELAKVNAEIEGLMK